MIITTLTYRKQEFVGCLTLYKSKIENIEIKFLVLV